MSAPRYRNTESIKVKFWNDARRSFDDLYNKGEIGGTKHEWLAYLLGEAEGCLRAGTISSHLRDSVIKLVHSQAEKV